MHNEDWICQNVKIIMSFPILYTVLDDVLLHVKVSLICYSVFACYRVISLSGY